MNVVVIDGQGGRMGQLLVEKICALNAPQITLTAIGTNAIATSVMLKAGAAQGATGENPLLVACRTADVILGPIGILSADSMLGEVTPAMALAVGQSPAVKLLLPVNQCQNMIVGVKNLSMAKLAEEAAGMLRDLLPK